MKALKGYRGLDPSPRQLAAYCGGQPREYINVITVRFRSVSRGRETARNTRSFETKSPAAMKDFIHKGHHLDYPHIFVRYADGARRHATVRFSGNLVDIVTAEEEAIVASFRL